MVMSAMVQIVPLGERWNVLFNEAKSSWREHFIFHRMKIYVHWLEWKTFVLYNIKKNSCHLERLIHLNILKTANLFWPRCFRSKVTAVYHCMLNRTRARFYLTMTLHAFNGITILYHVTLYHPIKWQESTFGVILYTKPYECFLASLDREPGRNTITYSCTRS